MIPVIGFATLKRFDLADRLLKSINYPVEHLVIVDNSGTQSWTPVKPDLVQNMWVIQVPYGLGLVGAWNLIIKSTPYAPYWLLINDDAWFDPDALQTIDGQVDPSAVTFLDIIPAWSAVIFGAEAIKKLGLYDERFYPLYFDDNDMERRIDYHQIQKKHIPAKVHHENSSTLYSGYQTANSRTFVANQKLLDWKEKTQDYSQGEWSLQVRLDNRWD